jgi:predicted transcriptional regulator
MKELFKRIFSYKCSVCNKWYDYNDVYTVEDKIVCKNCYKPKYVITKNSNRIRFNIKYRIVELLMKEPDLTAKEIAQKLNYNYPMIYIPIKQLREAGIIDNPTNKKINKRYSACYRLAI